MATWTSWMGNFILQNLIKNNPGQIVVDGAEPQWWDDVANATITDEDAAGEGIADKFERVFKVVTTADDVYGYQTLTFADEILLDAGVTELSLGVWVYCAAANKASVGIYGTNLGLVESDQHTGVAGWEYLTVEGVTLDAADTSIQVRLIVDTGTAYYGAMTLCPGPNAVMLKPRGLRRVAIQAAHTLDLNNTGDVAWADEDMTGDTHNLAVAVEAFIYISETGCSNSYGALGHSDDLIGADDFVVVQYAQVDGRRCSNSGTVSCNDTQVIRYCVEEGDADNDCFFDIYITAYWMWE